MAQSGSRFPAYAVVNEGGDHSVVLVCDHASNVLPPEYGTLGLDAGELTRHIGWDIGAGEVTRALAGELNAPAVLAGFSRLLIDPNRGADDPTLVVKLSDGAIVPGNRHADVAEIEKRIARYHEPYHQAIAARIAKARAQEKIPVIVSIHSFTPVFRGQARPWQIGILWDKDARVAKPLIARLRAEIGLMVGDNQPYTGELENDCMSRHATRNGLPHALIEIRQDLIETKDGARHWAALIARALRDVLALPNIRAPMGDPAMDEKTRRDIEADVFRRLVAHLQKRTDVQNIDMMNLAGFCRNCLGDWFREAADARGLTVSKDQGREFVYGMPQAEWKAKYQREAAPEAQAKFAASKREKH